MINLSFRICPIFIFVAPRPTTFMVDPIKSSKTVSRMPHQFRRPSKELTQLIRAVRNSFGPPANVSSFLVQLDDVGVIVGVIGSWGHF